MSKRASDVGRLGGGWIAAALGQSEYASPLDAYQRIVGEVVDEREGEAIDRGNFLEPALRAWHAKKVAAVDIDQPGTLVHREFPWATYTPDGIVELAGTQRVLAEYKSPGENTVGKYGEPGTDQVPRDVGMQVHWGLFVTDLPRADVAALIGGELRLFHVERDPDLEKEMFERARYFMEQHVAKKVPPPPTYSERDTEWVSKRWPKSDDGKRIAWASLTPEQRKLVNSSFNVNFLRKDYQKRETELSNAIKEQILQDAVAIDGDESTPFKRLDWKSNETVGPAWKQVAEKYRELLLAHVPEPVLDGVVKACTGEPPRVFKFYEKSAKGGAR